MINQLDISLKPEIQREGCYLLSLAYIAGKKWSHSFTSSEINALYDTCLEDGHIDRFCYVMSPDGVLLHCRNEIFDMPQMQGRILQVGIKDSSGERFWNWVKGRTIDFTITCYKTFFGNKHFVVLDSNGALEYDPNPRCKVTTSLYNVYYRFYEGQKA